MSLDRTRHARYPLAAAVALAGAVALLAAVPAAPAKVKTVVAGIDNPRGVAIGPDGAVYVASAGRGGDACQGGTCLGTTSRALRVAGGKVRTVAKGLLSASEPGGLFATGLDGVSVDPTGKVFGVTTSGPPGPIKSAPKFARKLAGRLFGLAGGGFSAIARIDAYEWQNNVDGVKGDRNSNPYAVIALADRQIVVDAGANSVLEVRNGQVSLLAVIPKNGKAQAVPTSIAQGPTGDLFVGELAEGAGKGKARVWRIPAAGGAPVVFAKGFTTITGLAFGPDGSMYVTEFAPNISRGDFHGDVVKVAPDGKRTRLGGRKLLAPTGAAVDSSGAVYVSNYSVLPRKTPKKSEFRGAGGELVKITP